jgi:hypothetical protein
MTGLQAPWPAMGAHGRGRKGNRGEGKGRGRGYREEEGREGRHGVAVGGGLVPCYCSFCLFVRKKERREKKKREKKKKGNFLNLKILGEKIKR